MGVGVGTSRFSFGSFLNRTDLFSLCWITNRTEPTMVGQFRAGRSGWALGLMRGLLEGMRSG